MSIGKHLYRNGERGRSLTSRPGVGSVTNTAHLSCSRCAKVGDLNLRSIMPPDQIDKKFGQHGWALDPHLCPDCRRTPAKEQAMAKPTSAAMKAQAQMFHMLTANFDEETGRYAAGWSDARIATETGLAKEMVAEFRLAGFGEIKEPEELQKIRADINAVEALAKESFASMVEQIASLRGQLAKLLTQVA